MHNQELSKFLADEFNVIALETDVNVLSIIVLRKLLKATRVMREAQRAFFKNRTPENLAAAKAAEKEVDKQIVYVFGNEKSFDTTLF